MYTWKILAFMKNGMEVRGIVKTDDENSDKVAKSLLVGNENTFSGFMGEDEKSNIFIRMGEVSHLIVYL